MKKSYLAALLAGLALLSVPSFAHTEIYQATLTGPAEAPPNSSPGTGNARVTFDFDLATMRVEASFSALLGNVTVAHIHCCTATALAGTAGVATALPSFPGFPAGVTGGSYDQTFDLTLASSYNPAFVTAQGGSLSGALNALAAGAAAGKAYFNIHTSQFPGGEIRGFLQPVPEAETYALMLAGLGIVGAVARARRAI
jgi:hypothetical protein